MKLLHIVQSLSGGGVSNVIVNLVKEFHKLNIENVIVTFWISDSYRELLKEYSLQTYLLGGDVNPFNSIEYILFSRGRVEKIIKREKPDAIVIQPGWLSLYAHLLPRIPTIIIVHGTYLNEVRYMWHHPIYGLERVRYITGILLSQAIETSQLKIASSRKNTIIVAVSNNTKKELTTMGINSEKIIPVLNGVDNVKFRPMNKDRARALVEEWYGAELRDKVLLHVNPGPRKGTHILVKATAQLKKIHGRDFTLLIVGRLRPKTYREHVEKMIRGLGLEENVKIVGYVEHNKLPAVYNSADLTIVPSYSEGSPLVIPESLACGTPVVATNVGGNPEYLKSVCLNDLLVSFHDYDFSHLLSYKIEVELREKWCVNYESIGSWDIIAQCYIDILHKLLT